MAHSILTAEDLTCNLGSGNSRTPAHNSCLPAVLQDRFRSLPARSHTIRCRFATAGQGFSILYIVVDPDSTNPKSNPNPDPK
jgi:hypothetical protein